MSAAVGWGSMSWEEVKASYDTSADFKSQFDQARISQQGGTSRIGVPQGVIQAQLGLPDLVILVRTSRNEGYYVLPHREPIRFVSDYLHFNVAELLRAYPSELVESQLMKPRQEF